MRLAPSLEYALHPYLPERLGFRRALKVVNPKAARLLQKTDSNTIVTARARITLLRESRRVVRNRVPGDFVEFGVYRGGSAAVLASAILDEPARHLHLFDKWDDRPQPTDEDGHRKEQYSVMTPERRAKIDGSFEATRQVVEEAIKFPKERLHYHAGWYDDTIKNLDGPIAFANIDCDYYNSVKPVLAACGRLASPGAIFHIDDYRSWPGARQAVHEWLESTKREVEFIPLLANAIIRLK